MYHWRQDYFAAHRNTTDPMSVTNCSWYGLVASLMFAQSHAGDLICPTGSQMAHGSIEGTALRAEFCRDGDGVKNGPGQIVRQSDGGIDTTLNYKNGKIHGRLLNFDAAGALLLESEFVDGREVSTRATPIAVRRIIESINLRAEEQKKNWRFQYLRDEAVNYTVTISAPWSWIGLNDGEKSGLKRRLLSSPEFCSIFNIRGLNLVLIEVSYVTRSHKKLASFDVRRSECSSSLRDL